MMVTPVASAGLPPPTVDGFVDSKPGEDLSPLAWVHDELRRTLETAQKLLRRFLRESESHAGSDVSARDLAPLRQARALVHQGAGALAAVGRQPAAQVLAAADAALRLALEKPSRLDAALLEKIEQGSFAVVDYLGREVAGKPVPSLLLFPQARALLEAAGAERVHPADLWDHPWRWQAPVAEPGLAPRDVDAQGLADLEALTLATMRAPGADNLRAMSGLCASLGAGRVAAGDDPGAQLWQLAAAVFEAQGAGLLQPDVFTKRLGSRLLSQVRARLKGRSPPDRAAEQRLAQDLLFFCAQSRAPDADHPAPRLAAVRAAHGLAQAVPVDYAQSPLGRYDPALRVQAHKRVQAAKESWSALAAGELPRLAGLIEQFSLVGDSLRRLMPEGAVLADELQQAAASIQRSQAPPRAALAMEVATSLLYLEAALDETDFTPPPGTRPMARLAERIGGVRGGGAPEPMETWMEALYARVSDRQTLGSVVQELRASLASAEQQIDQFFRHPHETGALLPVPGVLQSMRGVLSVLGMDQAALAVQSMREEVESLAAGPDPTAGPQAPRFERLADNLGALGFLIDMLGVQSHLAKAMFRFDPHIGVLAPVMGRAGGARRGAEPAPQATAPVAATPGDGAPPAPPVESRASTPVGEAGPLAGAAPAPPGSPSGVSATDVPQPAAQRPAGALRDIPTLTVPVSAPMPLMPSLPAAAVDPMASRPAPVAGPVPAPAADAEMREVFFEEAIEVLQSARETLDGWLADPADEAPVGRLRRAFHTLKGSARMVGLDEFAAAAWEGEQRFNARLHAGPSVEDAVSPGNPRGEDAALRRWTAAELDRLTGSIVALLGDAGTDAGAEAAVAPSVAAPGPSTPPATTPIDPPPTASALPVSEAPGRSVAGPAAPAQASAPTHSPAPAPATTPAFEATPPPPEPTHAAAALALEPLTIDFVLPAEPAAGPAAAQPAEAESLSFPLLPELGAPFVDSAPSPQTLPLPRLDLETSFERTVPGPTLDLDLDWIESADAELVIAPVPDEVDLPLEDADFPAHAAPVDSAEAVAISEPTATGAPPAVAATPPAPVLAPPPQEAPAAPPVDVSGAVEASSPPAVDAALVPGVDAAPIPVVEASPIPPDESPPMPADEAGPIPIAVAPSFPIAEPPAMPVAETSAGLDARPLGFPADLPSAADLDLGPLADLRLEQATPTSPPPAPRPLSQPLAEEPRVEDVGRPLLPPPPPPGLDLSFISLDLSDAPPQAPRSPDATPVAEQGAEAPPAPALSAEPPAAPLVQEVDPADGAALFALFDQAGPSHPGDVPDLLIDLAIDAPPLPGSESVEAHAAHDAPPTEPPSAAAESPMPDLGDVAVLPLDLGEHPAVPEVLELDGPTATWEDSAEVEVIEAALPLDPEDPTPPAEAWAGERTVDDAAAGAPFDAGEPAPLHAAGEMPAAVETGEALEVHALDENLKQIGPLQVPIPLFNIYLNEADEHSRLLGTALAEWALERHRPLPDDAVERAHALAGSTATVGYTALCELARSLEHALARVQALGRRGMVGEEEDARLFVDAADEIRRLLHQFAAGFLKDPAPQILERLADHERRCAERLQAGPSVPAPEGEADWLAGIDVDDRVEADLFPIFEEEAHELLPRLASALREWVQRPDDLDPADAAMRALHTFKGGARLAGAMRLGELAHRLETRIERLATASVPPRPAEVEALLTGSDALQHAFEALRESDAQAYAAADAQALARAAATAPAPVEAPVELVVPSGPAAAVGPAVPPDTPAPAAAPTASDGSALAPASGGIDWSRFQASEASAPDTAERAGAPSTAAVRVRAALLERMVNQASEVNLSRARVEVEVGQVRGAVQDLSDNLERLRQQLHDIELQAELQMSSRMEATKAAAQEFDPLEIDRYTRFQELTRMMAESVNDVATVHRTLKRTVERAEDELAAQTRLTRDLQADLLRTRMVEFETLAERLHRVLRQAAKETDKPARLDIAGAGIELDRGMLERLTPAFEHLLRNAVTHGIETSEQRHAVGKPPVGQVLLSLAQQGNDVVIELRDDGAGLDRDRIRAKAASLGLPVVEGREEELIFHPGFSTAERLTELAGRGVGLDVVRTEVTAVGGRVEVSSRPGEGTRFLLTLPLTTAVTQVMMLRCGDLTVAVPATLVERVRRVDADELAAGRASGRHAFGEQALPFHWLGALLQHSPDTAEHEERTRPVVIVRSAQQRLALHVDEVLGHQEAVVKPLGPQLSRMPGLAGMSVLASGRVALIYNPLVLAAVYGERARAWETQATAQPAANGGAAGGTPVAAAELAPLVLVVDDSLTVRRVTQRLLVREGYRVQLAKDGVEALERVAAERPRLVLSDIEMPRMDGFELVRLLRADAALADLPVVMITSRIAEKHREHASALGVDHYLGKPYGEDELLSLVARYARVRPADEGAPDFTTA
jgi:chemosensory pili system protein ChpA (sensor histidine kinase/response regulator)